MPWVIAAAALAGMAMSAESQRQQGKEAKKMHEYNAELERRKGRRAVDAAADEEVRRRKMGERLKSRQRALFAGAGVGLEGTPLAVLEDTAGNIEWDAFQIRRKGKQKKSYHRSRSELDKYKGQTALVASRWGMGSTIATGTTSAVSRLGTQKNWWT